MNKLQHVAVIVGDGVGGTVVPSATSRERTRALEGPGDDVHAGILGGLGVVGGGVLTAIGLDEHLHGGGDVVHALGLVSREVGDLAGGGAVGVVAIEEHSLLPEVAAVLDPVHDVRVVEGLEPDVGGGEAEVGVLLDHLGANRVVLGHPRALLVGLELGSRLATVLLDEFDGLLVGDELGALGTRGVEVGTPFGGAVHVFRLRRALGVERVHLPRQILELGEGEVRGAALDDGVRGAVAGRERGGALGLERSVEDVGGGVEVALVVAADELTVLGDSNVAFDDTGTLLDGGHVRLVRVLRKLHARSAVADGEVVRMHDHGVVIQAGLQRGLERRGSHVRDDEVGARTEVDGAVGDVRASSLGLLQDAVGVEGGGRGPVGEDSLHADVLLEDVNKLQHVAVIVGDGVGGTVVPSATSRERTRALEGPGDDVHAGILGGLGVVGGGVLTAIGLDEHLHGGGDVVHALGLVSREVGDLAGGGAVGVVAIEEHSLLPEVAAVLDPVHDVRVVEGLEPDVGGGEAEVGVLLDHLGANRVVLGHPRALLVGLELGSRLATVLLDEFDGLLVGDELGALGTRGVEVGTPFGGAVHVFRLRRALGVERVHLPRQILELGEGEVRGAALDDGVRGAVAGRERGGALGLERSVEDVGGGVEVALVVAADELTVLGDSNVAFDDTGTLLDGGHVRLVRVLRKLHARSAVADGEVVRMHDHGVVIQAGLQRGLERRGSHVLDEEGGARTEGDGDVGGIGASDEDRREEHEGETHCAPDVCMRRRVVAGEVGVASRGRGTSDGSRSKMSV